MRISFAGGGSDFPQWYAEHGGAVVSASIDKYALLTCRELPPFFDYRSRFVWSRIEQVSGCDEVVHPAIRGTLRYLGLEDSRLSIHHDGDLPARSGTGSSASFTVGLLHALAALRGVMKTRRQLALEAIVVDHDYAGDIGGCQDQVVAAAGGFNHIKFGPGPDRLAITWEPVPLSPDRIRFWENHLMLFYSGQARDASTVEKAKLARLEETGRTLLEQRALVDPCLQALVVGDVEVLGRVLTRSWQLKKRLAPEVTNDELERYCAEGLSAGALGTKCLGAGGGGMLLFVVPPDKQAKVKEALGGLLHVPFKFEAQGSQLIYYRP